MLPNNPLGPLPGSLEVATELARWACEQIREQVGIRGPAGVRAKQHPGDLVTDLDLRIEQRVRHVLAERFDGRHRVHGEEFGVGGAEPGAPTWYVDPIDGTANLAAGLGWCSFSLALAVGPAGAQVPVAAVVADPFRAEVFRAGRGQGAFLDELPLRLGSAAGARNSSDPDRSRGAPPGPDPAPGLAGRVVLTEWLGHRPWPGLAGVLEDLAERYAVVRIMGSSALALAQVAAGRAAAALLGAHDPIDDLAGLLVAQEAGALVRYRSDAGGAVLVCDPEFAEHLSVAARALRLPEC